MPTLDEPSLVIPATSRPYVGGVTWGAMLGGPITNHQKWPPPGSESLSVCQKGSRHLTSSLFVYRLPRIVSLQDFIDKALVGFQPQGFSGKVWQLCIIQCEPIQCQAIPNFPQPFRGSCMNLCDTFQNFKSPTEFVLRSFSTRIALLPKWCYVFCLAQFHSASCNGEVDSVLCGDWPQPRLRRKETKEKFLCLVP